MATCSTGSPYSIWWTTLGGTSASVGRGRATVGMLPSVPARRRPLPATTKWTVTQSTSGRRSRQPVASSQTAKGFIVRSRSFVVKDATAVAQHPDLGDGYQAALVNFGFLASGVFTTTEAVGAIGGRVAA